MVKEVAPIPSEAVAVKVGPSGKSMKRPLKRWWSGSHMSKNKKLGCLPPCRDEVDVAAEVLKVMKKLGTAQSGQGQSESTVLMDASPRRNVKIAEDTPFLSTPRKKPAKEFLPDLNEVTPKYIRTTTSQSGDELLDVGPHVMGFIESLRRFRNCPSDASVSKVLVVLQTLDDLPIDTACLRTTGIGMELNNEFWKSHPDKQIRSAACGLVRKWRDVVQARKRIKEIVEMVLTNA